MNPAQTILITAVRLYRWLISPAKVFLLGPLARCRYTPSCSEYALEAVRVHGATRGSGLALFRLCRCHPWGGCGPDPVPVAKGKGRWDQPRRVLPAGPSAPHLAPANGETSP